jgi:hypothetical protein
MNIKSWVKKYIKNRKEAYKLQELADNSDFTREEIEKAVKDYLLTT